MDVEPPPPGETVGSFRFLLADQRWEWSAEVARMHGYEPGNVVPTTELVLAHKHPDDKPDVAVLIERVIREGQPSAAATALSTPMAVSATLSSLGIKSSPAMGR